MKTWLSLSALLVAACGPSAPPPSTADGASERCAGHSAGDACMNDASFAQCREREAECPGEVLMLESCPLQFACP